MRPRPFILILQLAVWFFVLPGMCLGQPSHSVDQAEPHVDSSKGQATLEKWEAKLLKKFERGLYASLIQDESGCVDCHSSESMSPLVLTGHPLEDLRRLLDGNYLSRSGPDSFMGRVKSSNPDRRMPKDAEPWGKKHNRKLEKLIEAVASQEVQSGVHSDERFPRSLLAEWKPDRESDADIGGSTPPSQFLTYRQLRSKIQHIFQDDWVRGDRDRFQENIAAFAGADFKTRFNESSTASATYLSALENLARDVSMAAYRRQTGPFSDFDLSLDEASLESIEDGIQTLYRRILFREASESELQHAVQFLERIQSYHESIARRNSEVALRVAVTDPSTGRSSTQDFRIPVSGSHQQLQQVCVDQSERSFGLSDAQKSVLRMARPWWLNFAEPVFEQAGSSDFHRVRVGRLRLGPELDGELLVSNVGTSRNVTFAGVEIRNETGDVVRKIDVDDSQVELEGAWSSERKDGIDYFEDQNQHKGASTIRVGLTAEVTAQYEIFMRYRASEAYARNVLVELYGAADQDRLATQVQVQVPPKGVAKFHYHCGDDTRPFVELPGAFQFDEDSFVRISNEGTFERVTAAAIDFVNADRQKNAFLVDSKTAEGKEDWETFDAGRFNAYNVRGQKLHDDNKKKGKLELRYLLQGKQESGWDKEAFYRVRIYYPGKRSHEPQVPVEVHAVRSSPIIQAESPTSVRADTTVSVDVSASYTIQGSQLNFSWKQLAGPRIEILSKPDSPTLEFRAPRLSVDEVAWASLCSALVRHPDFLFTRPPASDVVHRKPDQERLQLLRISQDLVGRPPTESELHSLASGTSIDALVAQYLDSPEFQDYYFHRVRLYLESQGTELQDEPARLWTYIAINDRPFQEILTAEYTVDADWKQVARPDYHGRTGVLTTKGFIDGKPGLPHYNYAAQVSMLFLGYVYEVPPEIVEQREGVTALGTTDPNSNCYSCHKILTPLAFQRSNWSDDGSFRTQDESGLAIDASDRGAVEEYPFKGEGLEAFATQAVKKERFVRTIINTHVSFYFGRPMDVLGRERSLYKRLWDNVHENDFRIRELVHAIVTSPEYLGSRAH